MFFWKIGFGPIWGFKNPMAKVYSGYGMSTGPKIEKKKNNIFLENLKNIPLGIRIVSSIGIRLQYSSVNRIILKKSVAESDCSIVS